MCILAMAIKIYGCWKHLYLPFSVWCIEAGTTLHAQICQHILKRCRQQSKQVAPPKCGAPPCWGWFGGWVGAWLGGLLGGWLILVDVGWFIIFLLSTGCANLWPCCRFKPSHLSSNVWRNKHSFESHRAITKQNQQLFLDAKSTIITYNHKQDIR